MGDYYKIKKILLILLIVSVIFRIINQTKVFATEAIEVTPTWNDGDYTIQSDNNYSILMENSLQLQDLFINQLYYNYSVNDSNATYIRATLNDLMYNMLSRVNTISNTRFVCFVRNSDSTYDNCTFGYQVLNISATQNVVFPDLILNNGYKLMNCPHYSFSRNSTSRKLVLVSNLSGQLTTISSGTAQIPCACVNVISTRWLDLFQYTGVITSQSEYDNVLSNIEGSVDELEGYAYSSAYYAR